MRVDTLCKWETVGGVEETWFGRGRENMDEYVDIEK
jgi:hypothetical protein